MPFTDCHLALTDIDSERLAVSRKGVLKIVEAGGDPAKITATMDRGEALSAIVLNYTNPMAMLCRAMQEETTTSVTGLCHSVLGTQFGVRVLVPKTTGPDREVLHTWNGLESGFVLPPAGLRFAMIVSCRVGLSMPRHWECRRFSRLATPAIFRCTRILESGGQNMKFPRIRLFLLVFLVFLAGCASVRIPPFSGTILQKTSADGGQILLGNGSVVVNNVWNEKAAMGPHEQTIFESEEEGGAAIGWQWSWPVSFAVVSYPEVVYGDSPWSEPLGRSDQMPLRVGSRRMTADFDITIKADGVYNMAFSFWVVSALPATKDRVTHEIMIWNLNNRMTPAGAREDTMVLGGVTFDVWVLKAHRDVSGQNANTWDYIAFVARKPILKGPLDLSSFFDYLLGKGLISRDHYVTSVELGNEIVLGSGTVLIRGQSITIK